MLAEHPTRRHNLILLSPLATRLSAAKDIMTPEEFFKRENQSEDKIYKIREPGAKLARKLLD
jgi:hypothetical protein